jgi:hypothetical protein
LLSQLMRICVPFLSFTFDVGTLAFISIIPL